MDAINSPVIRNCFEADVPEKLITVVGPDGAALCKFLVRQLTVYEIRKCQSDDPETFSTALIKAGVKSVHFGDNGATILTDEVIAKLSRSRFDVYGKVHEGLFEVMAAQVMGINTVSGGEEKNSERR